MFVLKINDQVKWNFTNIWITKDDFQKTECQGANFRLIRSWNIILYDTVYWS